MSTFTLTGDDTLTLFGRPITDLVDGDTTSITFPNELVTSTTGKNQNTIYAKNASGLNAEMTLRVAKGSADDRFLLGLLNAQNQDIASSTLASGQFVKRIGDGLGNVVSNIYNLQGGVFSKMIDAKENVQGDTEQAVSVYTMRFALATSTIA